MGPAGLRRGAVRALVAFVGGLIAGGAAAAERPKLGLPLDCRPGIDCVVQNYVDHDPGHGWRDHMCGAMTYDGHDGIDFRIRSLAAMRRGVAVRAALPGTVIGTRDEVPDVGLEAGAAIKGRECGNGVVIAHADGWSTQYCHMALGSIAVKPGDKVVVGQQLGRVGLSGQTAFPHLHLTVRHDGRVVDPFAADSPLDTCGSASPLWAPAVAAVLPYRDRFVLNAGFADRGIVDREIEQGVYDNAAPTTASSALAAYVRVIGLRAGDALGLVIFGPDGKPVARAATQPLGKPRAVSMIATGLQAPPGGFAAGRYTAVFTVQAGGRTVSEQRFTTTLAQP
ncbi:M23 family metallopeptidase [Methyloraptor flagellatus]|uniref:M23 family metallopeptidase n=1 Tax=Methyloraptor flagellatus TaxID=3162530 RepID=A0AAU7XBF9_9HYPH